MEFKIERDVSIAEAMDLYLDDMYNDGILSKASVENRRIELIRFKNYCHRQKLEKPHEIHKNLLKIYLRTLKVSNGTKNALLYVYRSFFDFLVSEGIVVDNIAATITRPKINSVSPDYLTLDELEMVYRWVAENAGRLFVDRNLLLLSIMVEVGLRVSAIINLKFGDVRLETKQLWVRQKGGNEKLVPITDSIVSLFENWYATRASYKNAETCKFVFMATSGRQLTRKQVYEIVSQALRKSGLVKRRQGPHLLRHTGATLRALRGDDIEALRVWLDHTSYTMSKRYVHSARQLRQKSVEDEILIDKDRFQK
jgi:integrase/recombinase XerD